jgi:hypothetical protein
VVALLAARARRGPGRSAVVKCSSGCGATAEVVASRPGDAPVLLLCWEHAKGLAAVHGVRVRAIRPGRGRGWAGWGTVRDDAR